MQSRNRSEWSYARMVTTGTVIVKTLTSFTSNEIWIFLFGTGAVLAFANCFHFSELAFSISKWLLKTSGHSKVADVSSSCPTFSNLKLQNGVRGLFKTRAAKRTVVHVFKNVHTWLITGRQKELHFRPKHSFLTIFERKAFATFYIYGLRKNTSVRN